MLPGEPLKKQKLSGRRAFGAVGYGYLCKIYVWPKPLIITDRFTIGNGFLCLGESEYREILIS